MALSNREYVARGFELLAEGSRTPRERPIEESSSIVHAVIRSVRDAGKR